MHEPLHPRDDIDRMYVLRNEEGRSLRTALLHQHNDSQSTLKRAKRHYLQQTIIIIIMSRCQHGYL